MTIKTLTVSMLLAASLLLLTGCGDKDTSEVSIEQNSMLQTNTNTGEASDGEGDTDNEDTTTGTKGTITHTETSETGDDNTVISKENDDSSTTSPAVTLASLKLTIDKTSLNKDENTTVKVMAIYSDNSTKELDTNIEWLITPTDSVDINGSILTAKIDSNVTVQAKVGSTLSTTLNLTIAWVVNGHILPPEPDPVVNNSTLFGIDTNGNGVRDDVERWIYETYKDKHPIHVDIAMQAARGYKLVLETPERAKEIHGEVDKAMFCQLYYRYGAKYYGDPILIKENAVDEYFRSKIYFNTQERMEAYEQFDTLLSGNSYTLPKDKEKKAMCNFDTSKYED